MTAWSYFVRDKCRPVKRRRRLPFTRYADPSCADHRCDLACTGRPLPCPGKQSWRTAVDMAVRAVQLHGTGLTNEGIGNEHDRRIDAWLFSLLSVQRQLRPKSNIQQGQAQTRRLVRPLRRLLRSRATSNPARCSRSATAGSCVGSRRASLQRRSQSESRSGPAMGTGFLEHFHPDCAGCKCSNFLFDRMITRSERSAQRDHALVGAPSVSREPGTSRQDR